MAYKQKRGYRRGDPWVVSDASDFEFRRSEMVWDSYPNQNQLVHRTEKDEYQPLTRVYAKDRVKVVRNARPPKEVEYISTTITQDDL